MQKPLRHTPLHAPSSLLRRAARVRLHALTRCVPAGEQPPVFDPAFGNGDTPHYGL